MNTRMIARSLGLILLCLAALLLLPLIAGLYYGESVLGFIVTIAISAAAAFVLTRFKPGSTDISAREGFVIVGMGWILLSAIGALPFVISGDIPNYIDALFETASGLTTTGATIMTDIEAMSRGGMFWRMFTHWIGGMGVLVFIMAVMPMNGAHSMHLMRAEVPGPTVGKLVPRVRQTARILYLIYFALTIIEAVLLRFGGMSNYDALLHAFDAVKQGFQLRELRLRGRAATGGFSTRAASIAAFDSVYIEMVIAVFMLIFSVNFNLYYLILLGRIRDVLHDEELRCYLVIVAFATVTMGINIADQYGGFIKALRYSFFNVLTISSSTGFGTADFTRWPQYSQSLIVILMLIGAMAGSTGGGIKLSRALIFIKTTACDFMKIVSPRMVKRVAINGQRIDRDTVRAVYVFCALYALILVTGTLLVSFDGYDMTTNFTAVISCLSNIGPGLGLVGPAGSFAIFSPVSKLIFTFIMLAGRLEFYPLLALFVPSFWKK